MTHKKLSDLIREGGAQYPQIRGEFGIRDADGQICGTCALGAAGLAARAYLPNTSVDLRPDSICGAIFDVTDLDLWDMDLYFEILDRNDIDQWTYDQIADWLEGLGY